MLVHDHEMSLFVFCSCGGLVSWGSFATYLSVNERKGGSAKNMSPLRPLYSNS